MGGDRSRGGRLLGHLVVETGAGSSIVPLTAPAVALAWRVVDRTLHLDDPEAGVDAPVAGVTVPLRAGHGRTRLRWDLAYHGGRFWVTGSERPLLRLAGVTLDPSAAVDWPGGATVTWDGLDELRVGLERAVEVPRATVHCPECGREIRPIPLRFGAPSAFVAELSRRSLVGLGGTIAAAAGPTHACPACDFTFPVDEEVLAPSVFEAFCEWIEVEAGRAGPLTVTIVNEDDGRRATLRFDDPHEVIVGRGRSCSIVLDGPEVESMHARISRGSGGELWLADLASDGGTFVNGERVTGPRPLTAGDRIAIGPYSLELAWRGLRRP